MKNKTQKRVKSPKVKEMTQKRILKLNESKASDDDLIEAREVAISIIEAGKGYDQEFCDTLTKLLEIERELTLREDK